MLSEQSLPAAEDMRELSRSQRGMFLAEDLWGADPSPFHVMVSAEIRGPLDVERLHEALRLVTARHGSLRTVFARHPGTGDRAREVLAHWPVRFEVRQLPEQPADGDVVAVVHAALAPEAPKLLRPAEQPPVLFVLTPACSGPAVLTILGHHAVLDGWSLGLLWQEIIDAYGAPEHVGGETAHAPDMDVIVARERGDRVKQLAGKRALQLAGWPAVVQLPSDLERPALRRTEGTRLPFVLSEPAEDSCNRLVAELGVSRNAVVLAAWALVCGRRTGRDRLLIGVPALGRRAGAELRVIGGCADIAPVACELPAQCTVAQYIEGTARALREALVYAEVPSEDILARLPRITDLSRCPLVQVAFGAHDELLPTRLFAGETSFTLVIGHTGGAVYDAMLHLFAWTPRPMFELEYSSTVLTETEATDLADSLDQALREFGAAAHGALAAVTTVSAAQLRRLEELETGPVAEVPAGLWQLFEAVARREPDMIAIRDVDPAHTLSYRQLELAAAAQSARLAAAGVREGDRVALAVRRGAAEIVSILAVLRIGAAYVGLDLTAPPGILAGIMDHAGTAVILTEPGKLTVLGDAASGRIVLPVLDPWSAVDGSFPEPAPAPPAPPAPPAAPAAPPDPERLAYVAFTSGSTGEPKGAMIPCRGVIRLAHRPRFLKPGAAKRFLRLAPLAFDASTLEIFAPLLAGGSIEVYPGEYPTPLAIAAFLRDRQVTGLSLTAGLFRLVADFQPAAFSGVRQLVTGGDIVPPGQVAAVLEACPGLRITNGYGPTENTTFTTVHHVDAPSAVTGADLPIGRPIQGTAVLVLDEEGRRLPPGAIGELYASGDGLAAGYLGMPEASARVFGAFARHADTPLYRTGDLVRWDGEGNLRFLGRRDHQVKIRGFRVEPDCVVRVLREHPDVSDAIAAVVPTANGDKEILVAVRPRDGHVPTRESLRSFAAGRLPAYAVPSAWAVVDHFPVTRNGKVDLTRLFRNGGNGGKA